MLQFITNTTSPVPVSQQILDAIEGGCRWVQIRMKEASDDDIRAVFHAIREKARETETIIIINDRVHLARELGPEGVAGVHIGKSDMLPIKAREFLGPQAIIGVTANTFDDILAVRSLDIDYIGMGPYADTRTKENLAPILGLEGIARLCSRMDEESIEFARVAVGGIKESDVEPLLKAGVNGVAVSGAIANAGDIVGATRRFISKTPY